MCRTIKTQERCEKYPPTLPGRKRFVVGVNSNIGVCLADRKKGSILFDTGHAKSGEYPLINVALSLAACILGVLYVMLRLKKSAKYKKTAKLQAKEIKRLRRLCGEKECTKK